VDEAAATAALAAEAAAVAKGMAVAAGRAAAAAAAAAEEAEDARAMPQAQPPPSLLDAERRHATAAATAAVAARGFASVAATFAAGLHARAEDGLTGLQPECSVQFGSSELRQFGSPAGQSGSPVLVFEPEALELCRTLSVRLLPDSAGLSPGLSAGLCAGLSRAQLGRAGSGRAQPRAAESVRVVASFEGEEKVWSKYERVDSNFWAVARPQW